MTRARADFLLLLTALIWGTTFVAQKSADAHVGPAVFVGLRFVLAALLLLPLALWEWRRARAPLAATDWWRGMSISACLCSGCLLQQYAMHTTSATHAGFLTAAYMVLVPFVAWVGSGERPRAVVLAAAVIGTTGAWLLGGGGGAWSRGDALLLLCDFIWAMHITLVGRSRGMAQRPLLLSFLQCALTGVISVPLAFAWQAPGTGDLLAALPAIGFAGIFSSGVAFTMQVIAQRHTPPGEAALIMSLECVFSALAGALLLGDSLSTEGMAGAALIMLGVVVVEVGPGLLARRAPPARSGAS